MKSNCLILISLAACGLAAPAFSQEEAPEKIVAILADGIYPTESVLEFKAVCAEILAVQQRCHDALMAVSDAESAAKAVEVIKHEMEAIPELRDKGVAITEQDHESYEFMMLAQEAVKLDNALETSRDEMFAKLRGLSELEPPYYGCKELGEAGELYAKVMWNQMTPAEVDLLPKVVEAYKDSDMIRYEVCKCIAAVHDRASADAAASKLAALSERKDQNFQTLNSLLSQLPEEQVDDFCQVAYDVYLELWNEPGEMPADVPAIESAAASKMRELENLNPPFYGSSDLQERVGAFFMMPR